MTNLTITNNQMTLHTVDDFYKKIKDNLVSSMKAFLTMCKDLHIASKVLNKKDFLRLLKKLKLNKSTTSKLNTILESAATEYLIKRNRLPQNWTTAYEISRLSKDDFNKIKDKIEIDTSFSLLKSLLNNGKKEKTDFIKIEVHTKNIEAINYLSEEIKKIIEKVNSSLISSKNDNFKIANVSILKQTQVLEGVTK